MTLVLRYARERGCCGQMQGMGMIARIASATLLLLWALVGAMSQAAAQDEAHGREVFRKCAACHGVEPNAKKVGPTLYGVFGRKAGSVPGYNYSNAMKEAQNVWNAETLDEYLAKPRAFIPGNKMVFAGLSKKEDRADVIAYLRTLGEGGAPAAAAAPAPQATPAPAPTAPGASYGGEVKYTLRSGIAEGRMVYIGVGGDIDGQVNPELKAAIGDTVLVTVINGEGAEHDIYFPEQRAKSPRVLGKGASTSISFTADKAGSFEYYCTVAGHRDAGMLGKLTVLAQREPETATRPDIVRDPADLPPPLGARAPTTVKVELRTVELEGRLADGTTFT
jgi:nitrite reductase (NO-forming)